MIHSLSMTDLLTERLLSVVSAILYFLHHHHLTRVPVRHFDDVAIETMPYDVTNNEVAETEAVGVVGSAVDGRDRLCSL